ncbi:MAG: hypothetical protein LBE62_03470 [Azonexus sp.]|jgi:phage terminase Nu1 subunit (DNA packaging protein)|nr:hypothetical protein [Azonexus sp.]
MNFDKRLTQQAFGNLVGVSQSRVSVLIKRGTLPSGATGAEWLLAYCEHLREVAARQASEDGGLDLVQERALLARAQREGIEIKNAVLRQTYAPIELLAKVLAAGSAVVVERMEALPARMRKEVPDLPLAAYELIDRVMASARNEWVAASPAAALKAASEPDDET